MEDLVLLTVVAVPSHSFQLTLHLDAVSSNATSVSHRKEICQEDNSRASYLLTERWRISWLCLLGHIVAVLVALKRNGSLPGHSSV
jgi:hypothetical protein